MTYTLLARFFALAIPLGSLACAAFVFHFSYTGLQWGWWQAVLLSFPFAILGVVVMGASGVVELANRARAEATAPNALRKSIEPATRSSRGFWLGVPVVALAAFATVWAATPSRFALSSRGAPPQTKDVLVASADLRPTQVLSNENMRWQAWPESSLNPVYITQSARPDALEALTGFIVQNRMMFGEPIREANVAPRQVGVPDRLPQGKRAVAVRISVDAPILRNDRVDVLNHLRNTILRNIAILAVDQTIAETGRVTVMARTAKLELDPQQAEILAAARANGIFLSLPPATDNDDNRRQTNQAIHVIRVR
jgi:pilus assembly protein CpaB